MDSRIQWQSYLTSYDCEKYGNDIKHIAHTIGIEPSASIVAKPRYGINI